MVVMSDTSDRLVKLLDRELSRVDRLDHSIHQINTLSDHRLPFVLVIVRAKGVW